MPTDLAHRDTVPSCYHAGGVFVHEPMESRCSTRSVGLSSGWYWVVPSTPELAVAVAGHTTKASFVRAEHSFPLIHIVDEHANAGGISAVE